EGREGEPGAQLLGDGGAPDEVTLLENERAHTGLGKVGGRGQSVVAATDDDGVPVSLGVNGTGGAVARGAGHGGSTHGLATFRSGLKKGIGVVVARTSSVVCRMVVSTWRGVSGFARSGRTRAIPMWRCRTGEYMRLVA